MQDSSKNTCDNSSTLIPVKQALARMAEAILACSQQNEIEACHISSANHRILAEDIISPIDVPNFDNAAMDGYAYKGQTPYNHQPDHGVTTLKVIGSSMAGQPFDGDIGDGKCVRITTGAPIPKGADRVVMQENVQREEETIRILHGALEKENIRSKGEDIENGSLQLKKGKRLNPIDIALLASLGLADVDVYAPLTVAVFSTGDELCTPGTPLREGGIYDSNRYGICAYLERMGIQVIDLGAVADDPTKLKDALSKAAQNADVIISSGGVSVGDADHTKEVMQAFGDMEFWKVAIKPGKPFAFGKLETTKTAKNTPVFYFGLPGNPVSAMVTLDQLAAPMLTLMSGETRPSAMTFNAVADTAFKKRPGRTDYQRAYFEQDTSGRLKVCSSGKQGSGVMTTFLQANCYVVLEQERASVSPGETVTIQPFNSWLF